MVVDWEVGWVAGSEGVGWVVGRAVGLGETG